MSSSIKQRLDDRLGQLLAQAKSLRDQATELDRQIVTLRAAINRISPQVESVLIDIENLGVD